MATPLPDKTQEELEKIFKKFTNEIVLNTSDAYAITELLIIARDKAIKSITHYINKNYEVKTKKAPKSLVSCQRTSTEVDKPIISQENQLDEILNELVRNNLEDTSPSLLTDLDIVRNNLFEPATGTRGQGGLPLPGSVTDWQLTLTKDGWKHHKTDLIKALQSYIDTKIIEELENIMYVDWGEDLNDLVDNSVDDYIKTVSRN